MTLVEKTTLVNINYKLNNVKNYNFLQFLGILKIGFPLFVILFHK